MNKRLTAEDLPDAAFELSPSDRIRLSELHFHLTSARAFVAGRPLTEYATITPGDCLGCIGEAPVGWVLVRPLGTVRVLECREPVTLTADVAYGGADSVQALVMYKTVWLEMARKMVANVGDGVELAALYACGHRR